tara:strand:- start:904 stop:1233 length:330 start_codon:yes stop_codon:yes gene_type:complete
MERLGREPDPSKAPLELYHFPFEVQQAIFIHNLLPDRWDGMNGTYLGKDWSALDLLFKVHEVTHPKDLIIYLKFVEYYNSKKINADAEKERKARERKISSSPGTVAVKG